MGSKFMGIFLTSATVWMGIGVRGLRPHVRTQKHGKLPPPPPWNEYIPKVICDKTLEDVFATIMRNNFKVIARQLRASVI